MATPAKSLQDTPAPCHLSHFSGVFHATDDQQVPPTHLHPHADPSLQLRYQHKHTRPPVPLSLHSGPRLSTHETAAAALPGRTPTPFLAGMEEGIRDGVDQNIARPLRGMFSGRAGRNPICRISNPISRQVTFSKRRSGLLKKAYELSVLCDAEVGVIIFSATGRLSEFASPSTSMPKLIERYQEYSNMVPPQNNLFQAVEFWRRQVFLLRDQIFYQKNLHSSMLGENLSSLDLNDIQILEHKIEIAIQKIRVQKAQLIQAKEQESQRKEARLLEENAVLKRKLYEATSLHALKDMMLTRNHTQKPPWLDGIVTRPSTHEGSPLAEEEKSPSTASNLINQHLNNHLKLQLQLELFPCKPAE